MLCSGLVLTGPNKFGWKFNIIEYVGINTDVSVKQ